MPFPRSTGLLLHPTSLPSRGGIGDFGPAAYDFVDFLARARQGLWQVLPLSALSAGDSPYSSISAFAGNPLLISLERLAERGWLDSAILTDPHLEPAQVDYEAVSAYKLPLLGEAAARFLRNAGDETRGKFLRFTDENRWWLEDFVLFQVYRERHDCRSWNEWPSDIGCREPDALRLLSAELASQLDAARVIQFFFLEQWHALRRYCAENRVRVVGDIAFYVDYDSADVWSRRDLWQLKDNLEPLVVSGVPPDAFAVTGQRWGNPIYNWQKMREEGYAWWIERLRWATQTCDYIRLDHFRGFDQYWEIPSSEPTAIHGQWIDGPKDDLFLKLREALGGLPFFAEDLGFITESVHALRERLHIPGMAVLQFGFGDPGAHIYLPHRLHEDRVIYPGTHDNDTILGWWRSLTDEKERRAVESYAGCSPDGINWALIRTAQASVASLSLIPAQDILGLGSEARMNTPSLKDGNFRWRMLPGALTREMAEKLSMLAEVTDRLPEPVPLPEPETFAA
jgi:4-alpha-glucanotransferase